MGETRADRCDLAFELKAIGANVVPVNILNPIPGTPFAKNEPLPVMEILKTIACFRFILPRQEIMIAGGRTVNLRDAQSMIFMAGASALMVGNYLTTLNQPVEKDLQMLKDLGLDPNWDSHDFSDAPLSTSLMGQPRFQRSGRNRLAEKKIAKFRNPRPCGRNLPAIGWRRSSRAARRAQSRWSFQFLPGTSPGSPFQESRRAGR
jgi:radical SAM superfamily enzyme YgiQ (UPF0313 family)